ncbi:hypothetical protein LDL36_13625 [Komagataeibacter sp. FNDCR1]|nr:hypothetical protein [Komagataeibacter sp. FNDCR1]
MAPPVAKHEIRALSHNQMLPGLNLGYVGRAIIHIMKPMKFSGEDFFKRP